MERVNCENKVTCGNPIDKEVLLKALIVRRKSDGCHFVNLTITSERMENCTDYEPAISCGEEITFDQLLNTVIGIDGCDRAALRGITFSEAAE